MAENTEVAGLQRVVLETSESRHAGKVFVCLNGRRHWVTSSTWFIEQGYLWPDDVQSVPPAVVEGFLPGRPAARSWGMDAWMDPPRRTTLEMREIAVSRLTGRGIEVGAGASPMPIPLACDVRYVDQYDLVGLHQHSYEGQEGGDIIVPDVVASFEDLSPFADSSQDFVVACHVIEHTRDPVGALAGAWQKLRPGGWLCLVVPEIARTFDRFRTSTTLSHLIADYRDPVIRARRDEWHFREFYALALPPSLEEYEGLWRRKWAEGYPIHFHTWTHDSFIEMLGWMRTEGLLPNCAEVWSQSPLEEPAACNEFWVSLHKLEQER